MQSELKCNNSIGLLPGLIDGSLPPLVLNVARQLQVVRETLHNVDFKAILSRAGWDEILRVLCVPIGELHHLVGG